MFLLLLPSNKIEFSLRGWCIVADDGWVVSIARFGLSKRPCVCLVVPASLIPCRMWEIPLPYVVCNPCGSAKSQITTHMVRLAMDWTNGFWKQKTCLYSEFPRSLCTRRCSHRQNIMVCILVWLQIYCQHRRFVLKYSVQGFMQKHEGIQPSPSPSVFCLNFLKFFSHFPNNLRSNGNVALPNINTKLHTHAIRHFGRLICTQCSPSRP